MFTCRFGHFFVICQFKNQTGIGITSNNINSKVNMLTYDTTIIRFFFSDHTLNNKNVRDNLKQLLLIEVNATIRPHNGVFHISMLGHWM